jgi:hypothetical protein
VHVVGQAATAAGRTVCARQERGTPIARGRRRVLAPASAVNSLRRAGEWQRLVQGDVRLVRSPVSLKGQQPPLGFRPGGPPRRRLTTADSGIRRVSTLAGDPAWLVTGYVHVKALLADQRLGPSHPDPTHAPRVSGSAVFGGPTGDDPAAEDADRVRMRRLLAPVFSARRMALLRPRIKTIVDELLDALGIRSAPSVTRRLALRCLTASQAVQVPGGPSVRAGGRRRRAVHRRPGSRPRRRSWRDRPARGHGRAGAGCRGRRSECPRSRHDRQQGAGRPRRLGQPQPRDCARDAAGESVLCR